MDQLSKAFEGFKQTINDDRHEEYLQEKDAVNLCLSLHQPVKHVGLFKLGSKIDRETAQLRVHAKPEQRQVQSDRLHEA